MSQPDSIPAETTGTEIIVADLESVPLAARPVYETNAELAALEADIALHFGNAKKYALAAVSNAIAAGLKLLRYQRVLPTRDFKKRVDDRSEECGRGEG